jgi:glycosyltransferase involved in cell wall biosynthesis
MRLSSRKKGALRIAILSDFVRIPYANGAVFQTRWLYRSLRQCGHDVTIIGPGDPEAKPDELAPGTIELPSVPLKMYPGVHLPVPLAPWVYDVGRWDFDLCFAQTTSMLLEFGLWLREMKGTPLLCVNTTHLAAAYDVLLPERLSKIPAVHGAVEMTLKRPFENVFANIYNGGDGLIVLSEGLRTYWRERGVTVPIHVVPRAVSVDVFDRPLGDDPYPFLFEERAVGTNGLRLLCAGRHTREKSQDRVIRIFAKHVLPAMPDAVLVMAGAGPDTNEFQRVAAELGVRDRVVFAGEIPFGAMPDFYRYADVFVHASLSETYGNVLGEALYCGMPTVAMADGMGASSQITDGVNGLLIDPRSPSEEDADAAFGAAVLRLARDPLARKKLGLAAVRAARDRHSPEVIEHRLADAFLCAERHAARDERQPRMLSSKTSQLCTTLRRFQPWTTIMGSIYLFGYLRKPDTKRTSASDHPRMAV